MNEVKICPHCSEELEDKYEYCPNCGKKIDWANVKKVDKDSLVPEEVVNQEIATIKFSKDLTKDPSFNRVRGQLLTNSIVGLVVCIFSIVCFFLPFVKLAGVKDYTLIDLFNNYSVLYGKDIPIATFICLFIAVVFTLSNLVNIIHLLKYSVTSKQTVDQSTYQDYKKLMGSNVISAPIIVSICALYNIVFISIFRNISGLETSFWSLTFGSYGILITNIVVLGAFTYWFIAFLIYRSKIKKALM